MLGMTRTAAYDDRVRAWAEVLRARDRRTWSEFLEHTGPSVRPSVRRGTSAGPLPGAPQLELVRLLAGRDVDDAAFEALANLVLRTPSPGRGLVDPPLPWPDGEPEFGTPPVVPEELPAEELVRAACAVLVRLLRAQPVRRRKARRRLVRRRGVVLAGAPVTVAAVRETLRSAGIGEGGPRPAYVVLGGPFEQLMAERWCAGIAAGGSMTWPRSWRSARTRDRGFADIDLPALAAAHQGGGRVHVVLGASQEEVARTALGLLGVRRKAEVPAADSVAADLLRRLNPLLVLAAGEQGWRDLVTGPWAAAVAARTADADRLAAPSGHAPWAAATATLMAGDLEAAAKAGDYAVHGDPATLVPATAGRDVRRTVPAGDVLDLALELVATLWRTADPAARPISEGAH